MPLVPMVAERFAKNYGCVEGCRQRGVSGLLQIRVVRFAIGVVLSQIYTRLVRSSGNRRLADRGDVYDTWHATLAATADVFLTFDERLADHIERIPNVEGFTIVRSVSALLDLEQARSR